MSWRGFSLVILLIVFSGCLGYGQETEIAPPTSETFQVTKTANVTIEPAPTPITTTVLPTPQPVATQSELDKFKKWLKNDTTNKHPIIIDKGKVYEDNYACAHFTRDFIKNSSAAGWDTYAVGLQGATRGQTSWHMIGGVIIEGKFYYVDPISDEVFETNKEIFDIYGYDYALFAKNVKILRNEAVLEAPMRYNPIIGTGSENWLYLAATPSPKAAANTTPEPAPTPISNPAPAPTPIPTASAQPTPTPEQTQIKPPEFAAVLWQESQTCSFNTFLGSCNPQKYIMPDNEVVKYVASFLDITTPNGALEWKYPNPSVQTEGSFINKYVTDNKQFNYPPNGDKWQNPDYYLANGLKNNGLFQGDCEDAAFAIASILESKNVPTKLVGGYFIVKGQRYRDIIVEYKINGTYYRYFGAGAPTVIFIERTIFEQHYQEWKGLSFDPVLMWDKKTYYESYRRDW